MANEERNVAIRIDDLLATMEKMSAEDMGWLPYRQAVKFHKAVDLLRSIVFKR